MGRVEVDVVGPRRRRELSTSVKIALRESIIMISSEMEEVLRMSDRIVVMCDGRITGVLPNAEATQEKIMELATRFNPTEHQIEA